MKLSIIPFIEAAKKALDDYKYLFDDIPVIKNPEITSCLSRSTGCLEYDKINADSQAFDYGYSYFVNAIKRLSNYLVSQDYSITEYKGPRPIAGGDEHYLTIINKTFMIVVERHKWDTIIAISITLANGEGFPSTIRHHKKMHKV